MPVENFGRFEKAPAENENGHDELQQMMSRLTIPAPVASITYPRGCRIRRVRVPAIEQPASDGGKRKPVIVSRRVLKSRSTRRSAQR
jgi:hypothetical protein